MCVSETKSLYASLLIPKPIHRWTLSKEVKQTHTKKIQHKHFLKIWLCDVPGIETIIKIFQIGQIPTGFSQRGSCIQMCIRRHLLSLHTHRSATAFFRLKQHRGLGGISEQSITEELHYFGALLWGGCSPFILKRMFSTSFFWFPILLLSLPLFT